jgi:hypothetical protein
MQLEQWPIVIDIRNKLTIVLCVYGFLLQASLSGVTENSAYYHGSYHSHLNELTLEDAVQ